MTKFKTSIDELYKLREFHKQAMSCNGDVTVESGHFIVDGKSTMGLYSLDTSLPIKVSLTDNNDIKNFAEIISQSEIISQEE